MRKPTPLNWFVILSVITIVLALGLSPDPEALHKLHASPTAYRSTIFILLIPYVLVWYAGFYAYGKLQQYTASLGTSKDGLAFRKITFAMGFLAFSLVVPTILDLIVNYIAARNHAFKPASIIITNYLGLYPGLASFLLLLNGARALLRTTKKGPRKLDIRWHAAWFILLSVVFSHLVIENHYTSHPYHLPLILLITTIIVPYLYAWAVGFSSAYELRMYASTVRGKLYQRGVKQFAFGIQVTILCSIAIQFVNVTLMKRFENSLGVLALMDCILVSAVAAGLLLIALGTKKLKTIEDV